MKTVLRIFLSIIILFIFIIIEELNFWLWIKALLKYQRTHTENIDTSFFTDEMKKNILDDVNNIDSKKSDYIEITRSNINFYDSKHNLLWTDNLWQEIKELLQKYNINSININYINKEINSLSLSITGKKYTYVYEVNKHNYNEWYVLPSLAGRIEKVIDEYWYIPIECNRTICPEPQW